MTVARSLAVAACALLLASCAGRAPAPLPPVAADADAHQRARETQLATQADWSMQGRIAVSNGKDGGNGRIEWTQRGARFNVALTAPITRQGWRLSGGDGAARLDGLRDGPRTGPDAADLLREATHWDIPVDALAAWMRGARADAAAFGSAQVAYGGDGRLARLVQDGWTIDYAAWQAQPQGPELPTRLTATRAAARVRLVVDTWGGDATTTP